MSVALETVGLGKRFGHTLAVADVNLTVETSAAVALFGPNGAGKTTLIRLCATLLRPSSGTLRVLGIDAHTQGSAVRRRIALLAHESFLYPDLSVTENLNFYARLFKVPDPAARVRLFVDRMGLQGWAHRPVRVLSRGLVQRAALARVLLHQPEILFLDEPFTGLDADATATLRDVLSETHQNGTTVVMSTHNFAAGFTLCSQAVLLVQGRITWRGPITPSDQPRFEREYHTLTHTQPPIVTDIGPTRPRTVC